MPNIVKIVLSNVDSKIVGTLPDGTHEGLSDALSYKVANAKHIPSVKKKKWDGYIRLYSRYRGQSFYTGLLSYVRDVLDQDQVDYTIVDRRNRPEQNMPNLKFSPPSVFNYEARDYQDFTIDRSMQFTRGVLSVCTGGGKTMIVTRMIAEIKTCPFIFYVLTKDLMRQAHETLSSCLNEPIGMIGDGKSDIQKITVCTIQTALRCINMDNSNFKISDYHFDDEDKWDEKGIESAERSEKIRSFIRQAKGLYFDECHHSAAKTVMEVLKASPNAYWKFGGSATPYREAGDDIMIQAMFGRKVVDIPASYLIRRGFLLKPYIFFEPIEGHTTYRSYKKIYKDQIVENREFNMHVADTANFLNSRGLSSLVLVQEYAQGEYLKTLIPNCEFVTGRMTTNKRNDAIQDLKSKRTMSLIATSLADEGLDIPTLDAVQMAGGGASATRANQRVGRTLRPDRSTPDTTKDKSIVIAYDHFQTRYLCDHTTKLRRILKQEKEFVLRNSGGPNLIRDEIDELLGHSTGAQFGLFS